MYFKHLNAYMAGYYCNKILSDSARTPQKQGFNFSGQTVKIRYFLNMQKQTKKRTMNL